MWRDADPIPSGLRTPKATKRPPACSGGLLSPKARQAITDRRAPATLPNIEKTLAALHRSAHNGIRLETPLWTPESHRGTGHISCLVIAAARASYSVRRHGLRRHGC